MKKTITFLIALAITFAVNLNAQVTIVDNFDANVDYLTNGVEGTVWSGFIVPEGSIDVAEFNTITNSDALTISVMGAIWDNVKGHAPFLYIDVPANERFEASFQVIDGSFSTMQGFINYNLGGLTAIKDTVENSDKIDWFAFDQSGWSLVHLWESHNDGAETEAGTGLADNTDTTLTNYPWLKLARDSAGIYTGFFSADGTNWITYPDLSADRSEDMLDTIVKVGLIGSANIGLADAPTDYSLLVIDNFKLFMPDAGESAIHEYKSNNFKPYYSASSHAIIIKTLDGQQVSSAKLISVDGRIVKSVDNFTGSSIEVSEVNKGLYIVVAELADGTKQAKKVLIY